ncbi:hypothetical protein FISHEDRAFT_69595 [Fistulina hepatica ATCC 64428]|uniref:TERF2-interacting telomeric protein 1 Myb domain-containing protein n=1 Tax=Fistulina hepatica ATCC 64428 TaxID=1128425 RepID=A0A0D7ALP8_9AGAR|nr:hypothetical protein FISHEDRAFT_69595 [Fistulina hepatica ATCC 64428]
MADDELFRREHAPVVFYFHHSIRLPGTRNALTRKIESHGGVVSESDSDADVVLIDKYTVGGDNAIQTVTDRYSLNDRFDIHVEHLSFVQRCINCGHYEHTEPIKRNLGGNLRGRTGFTEKEDEFLIRYLAIKTPTGVGRSGQKLYKHLVQLHDPGPGDYAWVRTHTWQSWRERYVKNKEEMNRRIALVSKELPELEPHHTYEHTLTPVDVQPRRRQRATIRSDEEEEMDDETDGQEAGNENDRPEADAEGSADHNDSEANLKRRHDAEGFPPNKRPRFAEDEDEDEDEGQESDDGYDDANGQPEVEYDADDQEEEGAVEDGGEVPSSQQVEEDVEENSGDEESLFGSSLDFLREVNEFEMTPSINQKGSPEQNPPHKPPALKFPPPREASIALFRDTPSQEPTLSIFGGVGAQPRVKLPARMTVSEVVASTSAAPVPPEVAPRREPSPDVEPPTELLPGTRPPLQLVYEAPYRNTRSRSRSVEPINLPPTRRRRNGRGKGKQKQMDAVEEEEPALQDADLNIPPSDADVNAVAVAVTHDVEDKFAMASENRNADNVISAASADDQEVANMLVDAIHTSVSASERSDGEPRQEHSDEHEPSDQENAPPRAMSTDDEQTLRRINRAVPTSIPDIPSPSALLQTIRPARLDFAAAPLTRQVYNSQVPRPTPFLPSTRNPPLRRPAQLKSPASTTHHSAPLPQLARNILASLPDFPRTGTSARAVKDAAELAEASQPYTPPSGTRASRAKADQRRLLTERSM